MTGNNGKLKEMGKLKETSKLKKMGKLKEMSEMEIMSPIMDIECEQMVILGMMTDYHCLAESDAILDEECFYSGSNRDIYRAVKSVYASGDTPDLVSVNAELRKMGSGVTLRELAELCRSNAHPYDITLRAYRLKELSYRRRLRDIAALLHEAKRNVGERETAEVLQYYERGKKVFNVQKGRVAGVSDCRTERTVGGDGMMDSAILISAESAGFYIP